MPRAFLLQQRPRLIKRPSDNAIIFDACSLLQFMLLWRYSSILKVAEDVITRGEFRDVQVDVILREFSS